MMAEIENYDFFSLARHATLHSENAAKGDVMMVDACTSEEKLGDGASVFVGETGLKHACRIPAASIATGVFA
jgi:hypothetical protein